MPAYRKGLDFVVTPCGLSLSLSLSLMKSSLFVGLALKEMLYLLL